jgi:hypothetical protein
LASSCFDRGAGADDVIGDVDDGRTNGGVANASSELFNRSSIENNDVFDVGVASCVVTKTSLELRLESLFTRASVDGSSGENVIKYLFTSSLTARQNKVDYRSLQAILKL